MPAIIDFHTHAFPDALAPRAVAQLTINAAASGYTPKTEGTVTDLLRSMDESGVDRSVVCNIATNARQMQKVNDFAITTAKTYPRLSPLGSLHPDAPVADMEAELGRLAEAGIRGIKIHPDYVGIELDAPPFAPILSLCEARGMFVVTHAGFDPVAPDHIHATPTMLLRVIRTYPRLRLVAAHTGGFACEDEVLDVLCGSSIYFDTSLSAIRAARDPAWGKKCAAILREHDPRRILFATDSPWSTPTDEMNFLHTVGLSDTAMEAILHENAGKLLAE